MGQGWQNKKKVIINEDNETNKDVREDEELHKTKHQLGQS